MRGLDRPQDGRNAGSILERSDETAAILASDPGRAPLPACVGESLDDLIPFSPDDYVAALFEEKW